MSKPKLKLFFAALLLSSLALVPTTNAATDHQCAESPCETDGDGSTTCAVRCSDGSWSSIGCLDNETAHCSCSGYPVLANPYCTRNSGN
jgi:hypothetical protein